MSNSTQKIKPVALHVIADNIPPDLRAMECWLVWSYVEEIDPETGEVDWDKPPLNARGGAGSSTNPRTWSTFETALAVYLSKRLDGLGFTLSVKKGEAGEVLIAVDLDHCRNPETGEIEPWAKEIIAALNSYTEVSPSGEGIRIFLYGKLPPHGRKRGNFECYCSGRYVTVTGQRVEGTPATIESREAELLTVHK
jgi:primase-polymerase (primpol)-like protein